MVHERVGRREGHELEEANPKTGHEARKFLSPEEKHGKE
jgi:hypothetical protein